MSGQFTGDRKRLNHFLLSYERGIIDACLPHVPLWMSTVHLTLMTLLWSAGIVFSGWLAAGNIHWLWLSSLCVFLQHVTDMLDGEVGRGRNEGLIKWGFYMDHFLDYVFLCSIVIGYSFLLPVSYAPLVLAALALLGGFMVHVLLDFSITSDFKISFRRFGASEGRYVVIALNTAIIVFGKVFFAPLFPILVGATLLALIALIYNSQQLYRSIDMDFKQKAKLCDAPS